MTHRQRIDALVAAFVASQPPGAGSTPEAFALFAVARGARVRLVHASDGDHPTHGEHVWVRVLNVEGIHGYDVDLSAEVAGDGAPRVWPMDGRHPVTGVHRTLRITGVVPSERSRGPV